MGVRGSLAEVGVTLVAAGILTGISGISVSLSRTTSNNKYKSEDARDRALWKEAFPSVTLDIFGVWYIAGLLSWAPLSIHR